MAKLPLISGREAARAFERVGFTFDHELIAGKPESARIYHGFQVAKTHSMP